MAENDAIWRNWWSDLGSKERLVLVGAVVFILVGATFALFYVSNSSRVALFSNLEAGEPTRIANQLALDGIDNWPDEKEGRVLVSRDQVHVARIRVMERGIPIKGPVGFELFDEVEFGTSEFAQQVNYQRALEGELTRTILALEEIDQVRLHLVLPEQGLFRRSDEAPKASLTIGLKPDAPISDHKIRALQRLIASAVPGLDETAVSVTDMSGNNLASHSTGSMGTLGSGALGGTTYLEARRSVEEYLAERGRTALHATIGAPEGEVFVSVELEHNQRQKRTETVLPVGGGITGAVGSYRSWGDNVSPPTFSKEAKSPPKAVKGKNRGTEIQYEVGREVEEVHSGGAQIRRVTVSVVAPSSFPADQEDRLASTIGGAVGVDLQRGDTIVVHRALPVAKRAMPERSPMFGDQRELASASGHWQAMLASWIQNERALMLILAATLFLLLCLMVFARRRSGCLSLRERRQLLDEVRQWMSADTSPARGGPGGE